MPSASRSPPAPRNPPPRTDGAGRGLPISLQRSEARVHLLLHGRHTYQANVSDNALGTIASVEHALAGLPEQFAEREADVRRYGQQEEDLRKQLGLPFEHEEKLGAATRRQQELVKALDITKNQASANVDEGAVTVGIGVQRFPSNLSRLPSP